VCRKERLERVQCKYTTSNGTVITVRARSHSLTNGKIRSVKRYTAATIDWLAVYDVTTERCYYVPATELGDGMDMLNSDWWRLATTNVDAYGSRAHTSRSDGASRIRTGGLVGASDALYQLSYGPAGLEW
jgi:PD-(D/E)XK endonuclease